MKSKWGSAACKRNVKYIMRLLHAKEQIYKEI